MIIHYNYNNYNYCNNYNNYNNNNNNNNSFLIQLHPFISFIHSGDLNLCMYCLQDNTYIDIYIAPLQDYLLRSAPAETLAKENSKLQCCACKTYAFNKDV